MVYRKPKLVFGVGVNDADYSVTTKVGNKRVVCNIYRVWNGMIGRCYGEICQVKNPSYVGCSVAAEWHLFSTFKKWMDAQNWRGNELDKDILFVGNKVYSPDTCVFVDKLTNTFTTDSRSARGAWPLGVSLKKETNKFSAQCGNPFNGKTEYIGYFDLPQLAHEAWRRRKHEHALRLADLQSDPRVAQALRTRYL